MRTQPKQFVLNLLANGGGYLSAMAVSAWLIPYLIRHLGVASYGMIALASSVTNYLGILTLSLNGAVGRYLTIDLEQHDDARANQVFNTALFGNGALILLLSPVVVAASIAAPRLFDVPAGQAQDAQWLFAFTMAAFLASALGSTFSLSSWTRNRFELRNLVTVAGQIARSATVVLLFSCFRPGLTAVGAGVFVASITGLVGDVWLWRHLTPQLRVSLAAFNFGRVRQLFAMGGWIVVNQIGTLLFLNIDLVVINTLVNAEAAGRYSSIILFSTLLRGLAGTAAGVLTPTILAHYAQSDWAGMNRISKTAARFMGLALALPIGLLCGLAKPLLSLWLGPDFASLSWLLIIMVAPLSINLAVLPLFGLQTAFNKVKLPGIVTLSAGLLNLILAVAFVKLFGWGPAGVAIAGALVLTLKNALFTPVYAAMIQKLPLWSFLVEITPGLAAALVLTVIGYSLTQWMTIDSWLSLIMTGACLALLYLVVAFSTLLDGDDRRWLSSFASMRMAGD